MRFCGIKTADHWTAHLACGAKCCKWLNSGAKGLCSIHAECTYDLSWNTAIGIHLWVANYLLGPATHTQTDTHTHLSQWTKTSIMHSLTHNWQLNMSSCPGWPHTHEGLWRHSLSCVVTAGPCSQTAQCHSVWRDHQSFCHFQYSIAPQCYKSIFKLFKL